MADVTAIILTKNEEKNIKLCIESISTFCQRIVVVDSVSDDKTVDIARKCGADIFFHKFENYARQFNWGIDNTNITTKWTLRIDADEQFTDDEGIKCPNDGIVALSLSELKLLNNLITDKNVEALTSRGNTCEVHKGQKLTHYIEDTKELICVYCAFARFKKNPKTLNCWQKAPCQPTIRS